MDSISYLDFDLQIQRVGDQYRVQVLNSPGGQATATFTLPFSELELKYFLLRVGRTRRITRRIDSPEVQAAKEFGGSLFSAIFKDQVRDCLVGSLNGANHQGAGLRIRLRLTDVPELIDLPWEYLYNPTDDFLALSSETPVIRYLEFSEDIRPLTISPPLRVLVLISSPSDYDQLDVDREWANLRKALGSLEDRGLVTLERLNDGTLGGLQQKLRRGQFHIFHYIGHGGFDQQIKGGVLAFEDDQKRSRHVSGEDLGRILRDHRSMRLAVLNACEGGRSDRIDPFAGTAQSLIKKKIPAVIAMQFEITDEAAITFAQEFYGAIADGYPVDAALAEARKAIFVQGNGLEWGTPVLYLRSPDGRIFDVEQTEEMRKRIRITDLYEEAEKAAVAEDWELAQQRLKAILLLDSTHAEAINKVAQIQQQQELSDWYAEGLSLRERGDWRGAKVQFQRVRDKAGNYKDVERLIANAETEIKRLEQEEVHQREEQHQHEGYEAASRAEQERHRQVELKEYETEKDATSRSAIEEEARRRAEKTAQRKAEDEADRKRLAAISEEQERLRKETASESEPQVLHRREEKRLWGFSINPIWIIGGALALVLGLSITLISIYNSSTSANLNKGAESPNAHSQATVSPATAARTGYNLKTILGDRQGTVWSVAFSPTEQVAASAGEDTIVSVWDAQSWGLKFKLRGHTDIINSIAFSPDGKLIASGSKDTEIRLWKVADGSQLPKLRGHHGEVLFVAFSPDGQTLASASADRTVKLWDIKTGQETTLGKHEDSVWAVAFSPTSPVLASAGRDNTIKIWDLTTKKVINALQAVRVLSLAFSPDGETMASGHQENGLILWNWRTGQVSKTLLGHSGYINSVAFTLDGTTLASASSDKTVKLWDVKSGGLKQTLTGHDGEVESVSFSPDGTYLISGGRDKTVRVWRLN
jgi:hypothetical protein